MQEFKIRCSAIGQIMTGSRVKGQLGETVKTYCETWLKEQLYSRKQTIYSKYMQKGIEMENEAIELVERYYNYNFLVKNEERFENDFMTGTPDIILSDCIRDTKCSWDCFTFPLFEKDLPMQYYWQMQGYMALVGRDKAYVDFVLVDTPEDLDKGAQSYSDLPLLLRINTFEVLRNETDIELIYERVNECRKHINGLML